MTDYGDRAKLIAALLNQQLSDKPEDEFDVIERADFISNFVRNLNAIDPVEEQRKQLGIVPSEVPFLYNQVAPPVSGFDPQFTKRELMAKQGMTEGGATSFARGVGVGLTETITNPITNIVDLVSGSELTQTVDYKIEEFFGAHGELNKAPIAKTPLMIGKMVGMLPGLVGMSRLAGATIGSVNAIRRLGFTSPTVARMVMAAAEGSYQEMMMENPDPASALGFAALDFSLRWRRAGVAVSEALHTKRARTMGGLTKYFDTKEIRWFREAEVRPGALPEDFWWGFIRGLRNATPGTNTSDIAKTTARPLIARLYGDALGKAELVVNNSRQAKSVFVTTASGRTLNLSTQADALDLMDVLVSGEDQITKIVGPEHLITELNRYMTAQAPEEIETLFRVAAKEPAAAGAAGELSVVLEDVTTEVTQLVTARELASNPAFRRGIYDGKLHVRKVLGVDSDEVAARAQMETLLTTVFGRRYSTDLPGVFVENGLGSQEVLVRFRVPNPAGDGYIIEEVSVPMTRRSFKDPAGVERQTDDIIGFGGMVRNSGGGPDAWIDGATKLSALRQAGAEVFEIRVPNLADIRTRRVVASQLSGAKLAPERGRQWWTTRPGPKAVGATTPTPSGSWTPGTFPPLTPAPAPPVTGWQTPGPGAAPPPPEAPIPFTPPPPPGRAPFGAPLEGVPTQAALPSGQTAAQARGATVVSDMDMERVWMEERSAQLAAEAQRLNDELAKMDLSTPEAKAKLDELERIISAKNEFDEEIYRKLNPGAEGRPEVTGKALPAEGTPSGRAVPLGPGEPTPVGGATVPLAAGAVPRALPASTAPSARKVESLVAHEARLAATLEGLNQQKQMLEAAMRRGDHTMVRRAFGVEETPATMVSAINRRIEAIQSELANIRLGLTEVSDEMESSLGFMRMLQQRISDVFASRKLPEGFAQNHPIWGVLRSDHLAKLRAIGQEIGALEPSDVVVNLDGVVSVRVRYQSGGQIIDAVLVRRNSPVHEVDDLLFTAPNSRTAPTDLLGWQLIVHKQPIHVVTDQTTAKALSDMYEMWDKKVTVLLGTLRNRGWDIAEWKSAKPVGKPGTGAPTYQHLYDKGLISVGPDGLVWIAPELLNKVPVSKSSIPEFIAKFFGRRSKGVDPWIASFLARADRARMGQWVRGETQAPMSTFETKLRAAVASDMERGLTTHSPESAVMQLRSEDPETFVKLMMTHVERTPEFAQIEWIEQRATAILRIGQATTYQEAIEKAIKQAGYDMDPETARQLFSEPWHTGVVPTDTDPMQLIGGWAEESDNIWETVMSRADAWLVSKDALANAITKARTLAPMTDEEARIIQEHVLPMLRQWQARSRVTEDLVEFLAVRKERAQIFDFLERQVKAGTMGLDDYVFYNEFFTTMPREAFEAMGTSFEFVRTNMRVAVEVPTSIAAQPQLLRSIKDGSFVPTQMELFRDKGWVSVRRLMLSSDNTVSGQFYAVVGKRGKWIDFKGIPIEQTKMAGWQLPSFLGMAHAARAPGIMRTIIRTLGVGGPQSVLHEEGHIVTSLIPDGNLRFIAEQLGNWMAIQYARAMKEGRKLPEVSQQLRDLATAIQVGKIGPNQMPNIAMIMDPNEILAEFLGRRLGDVTKYTRSTTQDVGVAVSRTRHVLRREFDPRGEPTGYEIEVKAYEVTSDPVYPDRIDTTRGEVPVLKAMESEIPTRRPGEVGVEETDEGELVRLGDEKAPRPDVVPDLEEGYPKITEQRGLARGWRVSRRVDPLDVSNATPEQVKAANSLYQYLKTLNRAMYGVARPEDKALYAGLDALLDEMFDPLSRTAMRADNTMKYGLDYAADKVDNLVFGHLSNFWGVDGQTLSRNLTMALIDSHNTQLAYDQMRNWERYRVTPVGIDKYSMRSLPRAKAGHTYVFGLRDEAGRFKSEWSRDYDVMWQHRTASAEKGEFFQVVAREVKLEDLEKYRLADKPGLYRSPTKGNARFGKGSVDVDPRSTRDRLFEIRTDADAASAKELKQHLAQGGYSDMQWVVPKTDVDLFLADLSRTLQLPGFKVQRMRAVGVDGVEREQLVLVSEKEGYDFYMTGVTLTKKGTDTEVTVNQAYHKIAARVRRGIPPPEVTTTDEFRKLYTPSKFKEDLTRSLPKERKTMGELSSIAVTMENVWENIAWHHSVFGARTLKGIGIKFDVVGPEVTIPDSLAKRMGAIGMSEEDMLNGYHGAEDSVSIFSRMVRATNRFRSSKPGDTHLNVDVKPDTYTGPEGVVQHRRDWILHSPVTGETTRVKMDYENQESLKYYFQYSGAPDRIQVTTTHDVPWIMQYMPGNETPMVFMRTSPGKKFHWYLQAGEQADEAKDLVIVTDNAFVLPGGVAGDDVMKGALPTDVVNAVDLGFKLRAVSGPFGQGDMGTAVKAHLKRQAIGRWANDVLPRLDAAGLWSLRRLAAARGYTMRITSEGIQLIRPGIPMAGEGWAQPVVHTARTAGELRDILTGMDADEFLNTHQLKELDPLVQRLAVASQEAQPKVDPANPQADANAGRLQGFLTSLNERMLNGAEKLGFYLGNMNRLTAMLEEKTGIPIWRLYQRAHEAWQVYDAERITRMKGIATIIGDMDDESQRLITHYLDMGAFRTDLPDIWVARLQDFEAQHGHLLTPEIREKAKIIREWFDGLYDEFQPGYAKDTVPAEIAYVPWRRHMASGLAERAAEQGSPDVAKDPIDYVVGEPWYHKARLNQAWDPMYDDRIGSLMTKYMDTGVRHKHLRPISADFVDTIRHVDSLKNQMGGWDDPAVSHVQRTLRHINNIVTGNYGPGTTAFYGGAYRLLSKLTGNPRLAKFVTENMVTYGISSGLGFRPGSAIRNLVYAPLPVFSLLGGRHLGRGLTEMVNFMRGAGDPEFVRFVDREKNTYLDNWMADALDNFQRITVGRTPLSESIPATFMRRSLILQERTEVFNRGFSFFAGVSSGREIFAKWGGRKLTEVDIRRLLDSEPLGVFSGPEQQYLIEALQEGELQFVQRYANSVVRMTQFAYGPFESFRAANNKVGKLGFFFGSWTMNQAAMVAGFLRRTWTADGRITMVNPNSLKYLGRFMAGTVAGYEAMKLVGLDPDTTFAFTPTGYAGSPYLQTGIDLLDWFRTTGHRKEMNRNQFFTRLSQVFTPAGALMSDVIKGIDDINEDEYWHATGHVVFGTTPTEEAKAAKKGKFTHWAPSAPKRILHGLGFINMPKTYTKKSSLRTPAEMSAARKRRELTD